MNSDAFQARESFVDLSKENPFQSIYERYVHLGLNSEPVILDQVKNDTLKVIQQLISQGHSRSEIESFLDQQLFGQKEDNDYNAIALGYLDAISLEVNKN